MHLSECFFKGVPELGHMTDRHHFNSPAIIGLSYKSSSYYNIMLFLLGVTELDPMTDRHHYIYNTRALRFACATRMRSHVCVCVSVCVCMA